MLALLALVSICSAAEFFLETPPVAERQAALELGATIEAAGLEPRVVRRFKLGRGWEFVVMVEHFGSQEDAAAAAAKLATTIPGLKMFRTEDTRVVAVEAAAATTAPKENEVPALLARVEAAHGGEAGGSRALARAAAVHFVYTRSLELAGKAATVRHDYWRQGGSRRLAVESGGAGTDSLAVASASGAWIRVGDAVESRDLGVLIGTIDAFAPEAVLSLALDVPSLLGSPEVEAFRALEGAESGVRVGQGGDESEPGLAFVDIDPSSARLLRARYVTEAGPVSFELDSWKEVAPGVLVPEQVRVERADGRTETLRVEHCELAAAAPRGTFDKP